MTVKASPENLQKLLLLGVKLYKIGDDALFFQNLGSRYFKRIFDAMRPQQIWDNFDMLLSIPIPSEEKIFWEPFALAVDWRGFRVSPKKCSAAQKERIEYLISELDTENARYRSNVLSYLNVCFEVNLLSKNQKVRIAQNLQKHSSPGILPAINNFYKFTYIRFFEPLNNKREIEAALKEYYFRESASLFENKDGQIAIQLSSETNFIRMSYSLLATCSVFNEGEWMFFELSADDCRILFENLRTAWFNIQRDVDNILDPNNDPWQDRVSTAQKTFLYLDKVLGEVIIPRVWKSDLFEQVLSFIRELENHFYFPISNISACCRSQKYSEDLLVEFIAALNDFDDKKFNSYSYAVFNAYRFAERKELPQPPLTWLDTLISVVHLKTDYTFCLACGILGSILDFSSLPEPECKILLTALENLLNSTSFTNSSDKFSMQDRYDYRLSAAFLAAEFYFCYQKRGKVIPAVLNEWYELSKSADELPGMRNIWMRF